MLIDVGQEKYATRKIGKPSCRTKPLYLHVFSTPACSADSRIVRLALQLSSLVGAPRVCSRASVRVHLTSAQLHFRLHPLELPGMIVSPRRQRPAYRRNRSRRFGRVSKRPGHWAAIVTALMLFGLALAEERGLLTFNGGRVSLASNAATVHVVDGVVTFIRDGDTIEVEGVPIRLTGLAAPESYESGGSAATTAMREIVSEAGGRLRCELTGETSHDRQVGICYTPDGDDIAALTVARGVARDCPRYSGGAYRQFETDASRGLPLPDYC